jgi:hypothetical protein
MTRVRNECDTASRHGLGTVRRRPKSPNLIPRCDNHSQVSTRQRVSPSSVVQAFFPSLQHIAVLISTNGSTMGEGVWVEESGARGGK